MIFATFTEKSLQRFGVALHREKKIFLVEITWLDNKY